MNKQNQFSLVAVALSLCVGAQAHALTQTEKETFNNAFAQTQTKLTLRMQQYQQEGTSLNEMKADLAQDFQQAGLTPDQAQQMADRFDSEQAVLDSMQKSLDQAAVAGMTLFANTGTVYYAAMRAESPLFKFMMMVMSIGTITADLVLMPTAAITDLGNFWFGGQTYMAFLSQVTAGDKNAPKVQDAGAAWLSLVTAPLDTVLFPFYFMATICTPNGSATVNGSH